MQAASTVRGTGVSRSAGGFVIGLALALVIGGVGGFTARSLTAGQSTLATTKAVAAQHEQAPDAIDRNVQLSQAGGSNSDLTRALPTARSFDPADWWRVDGADFTPARSAPTSEAPAGRIGGPQP